MKYIYSILSLVVLLSVTSCSDDELDYTYAEQGVVDANRIDVAGTIEAPEYAAEGDVLKFTANIPESFESDVTIRVELVGGDYTYNFKDVVIPANETSVEGELLVDKDDFYEVTPSETAVLKMTGLTLANGIEGVSYNLTSNEIVINAYDQLPRHEDNVIGVQFDWENAPANDLDVYVFLDGSYIGGLMSGSRYESFWLSEGFPDANYTCYVGFYAAPLEVMKYNWMVTSKEDLSDLVSFQGTYNAADMSSYEELGSYGIYKVIEIIKSTDTDGNVSFTAQHF